MPIGMSESQARALAQQIEAEDARVKAIAQRCGGNRWYVSKTWEVVAILPERNLKRRCFRPQEWESLKLAWSELRGAHV